MHSESSSPLRVLVADDEPAMLNLVSRYMRSLGFDVIEASEGDAAWDLAQEHGPDLVILDVMMPGMSGWEVCKRLKNHGSNGGRFTSTGVIMLTGIGDNLNEMTSPLFAADAWLNKPFDFNDLEARVRDTLARYRSLRAVVEGKAAALASDPKAKKSTPEKAQAAKKVAAKGKSARSKTAAPAGAAAKKPLQAKGSAAKSSAAKSSAAKGSAAKGSAAKSSAAKTARAGKSTASKSGGKKPVKGSRSR